MSGCFRWDGDVIRLEQALLQQQKSRYELQGEYVLRARVVGGIYDGDDRLQTFAIPLKLRLKVDADEQEES